MNVSNDHKKSLTCNHCKKSGHTKANCYRLVGFPYTFKFIKNKREEPKSTVQHVTSSDESYITQDQYQQLTQLLSRNMHASTSHVNASVSDNAMKSDGPFTEE